jgi:hypothetical protein
LVRVLIVLILLLSVINASSLNSELENILGQNSYFSKKKFLNIIFKDQKKFYVGSQVDIHKVLSTLKENNLIHLDFKNNRDLHLSFATEQNSPLIFLKMIHNTLNTLGYSMPEVEKVMHDSSGFLYKVKLQTSSAVDPVLFANELKKQGCYISGMKRYSKVNYRYNINISNIDIVPIDTQFNEKIYLKKPLNPYWIDIESAKTILLGSSRANSWHPYIVFYDRDLKPLDTISKELKSYNEKLSIPRDAKYVKVSDIYTLENLKRGLSIYISK